MMFVTSLLFYFFVAQDGALSRFEGGILLVLLLCFLVFLLFFQKQAVVEEPHHSSISNNKMIVLLFLAGGFSLWLGSEVLIKGAISLAQDLGVSERIISISIVSIGTSIPELTASVIAFLIIFLLGTSLA